MAVQKNFPSVKATAFITATANNAQDFEDAKAFFKESLQQAVKESTAQAELEIYKEAVEGFLMQLERKDSTEDSMRRLQRALTRLRQSPEGEKPKAGAKASRYLVWPWIMLTVAGFLFLMGRCLFKFFI